MLKHRWLLGVIGLAMAATLASVSCAQRAPDRPKAVSSDVLADSDNLLVTALSQDCESVRMALGAALDDGQACRAYAGYLRSWTVEDRRDEAEELLKWGARTFEKLYAIDHGILSVRFARDSRDEPKLQDQVKFWRNELALAAKDVSQYAEKAASLKAALAKQLKDTAGKQSIAAERIKGIPWAQPQREAFRKAGAQTGVRLPLDPDPASPAFWWNQNLSVAPGYVVTKHAFAGETFFSPEKMIGAWGNNCTAEGQYDWTSLNNTVRLVHDRGGKFLLELPTLHKQLTDEEVAAQQKEMAKQSGWIWTIYAPPLPKHLTQDQGAALLARGEDGKPQIFGGVQLFNPATATAYGQYLSAMAADLKQQGLYDTIIAVHLEMGDSCELDDAVDYSDLTKQRWQAFMAQQYGDIAALNSAAGTSYRSFQDLVVPFRGIDPKAAKDWQEFRQGPWRKFVAKKYNNVAAMNKAVGTSYQSFDDLTLAADGSADPKLAKELAQFAAAKPNGNEWGNFLTSKYRKEGDGNAATMEAIRAALGDDFQEAYGWRLPIDYPPIIKIDYLHFRRAWVKEYLDVKRKLVAAAFPDKLIIAEMRQFGDHDGIAGKSEMKWGGFIDDDIAQFSNVGPDNANKPFMVRSVGPVGFGTRPSDSIESLFRDYLWINFRDPGNLLRYFYDWVAHGYLDDQLGWHGITNHWLTDRLIYQLGPSVANTAPQPQRIGLVLPRATFDLFNGSIYYEYLGWDWLLGGSKLTYTRIDEHFIREGKLKASGLQTLILPDARAMDDKVAAEIKQWVADGGLLIASTMPGKLDAYGRPRKASPLADVLGVTPDGTVSEAVKGTPLGITIPRGIFSGKNAQSTDRRPPFEALKPTTAKVLASYEGGKAAITLNTHGQGRAVVIGYPFGRECVEADRTSIGFYRTYTAFVREPQLVERTAWLRDFIVKDLGYKPEYGVDYAEVGRQKGKEAYSLGLSVVKGFSQTPGDWFYVRTFGDPRPGHEIQIDKEVPDMALRFFPRQREGVATKYLGISTREVHYIAPRGAMHMYLSPHTYKVRINNPKIQAIWDVVRDVPVGFERDSNGVSFMVSLPSGHLMMLAISETPKVELFAPDAFPGRAKDEVVARCKELAGGTEPAAVSFLNAEDIRPWLEGLAKPVAERSPGRGNAAQAPAAAPAPTKQTVVISYGEEYNKAAAEKLAGFLRDKFALETQIIQQATQAEHDESGEQKIPDFNKPLVFIGDEWTNNDLALHGSYWNWGNFYGPHLPFTSNYVWPGKGRAVIALSRKYSLIDAGGRQVGGGKFNVNSVSIRPVEDRFQTVRRKLHIAANGDDAVKGVDALIAMLSQ